ncbi:MAG: hypothetical protein IPI45_10945 [Saprospiraceae bacterium]|nr:hypothetical protein [Saprospiraceae bacterium]MBK7738277.1 hypothetical protein [Saprospiraceae bacterium]MBK7913149.1 hypothetical protein [Saprospiraceae bacterium]
MYKYLLLLAVLCSCSRKYHKVEDLSGKLEQYVHKWSPNDSFSKFEMNLIPYVFYRNKVSEKVMMTENSRIHDLNIYLIKDTSSIKHQRFIFFIPFINDSIPVLNQEVYFFSIKGLSDANDRKEVNRFELLKIYKGQISSVDTCRKVSDTCEYIFKLFISAGEDISSIKQFNKKMNSNLITCAPGQCKKNQNTFEVFISRRREVLKVHALIDYGKKHRDNLKSTVYDFNEMYKEVLFFIKK